MFLVKHFMYSDDLYIFLLVLLFRENLQNAVPSRDFLLITIHYMLILYVMLNNSSQEMTSIQCVNLNNRPLPTTQPETEVTAKP